jgi:CubicO group peptidase (beta-lactamase class C family)
MNRQTHRLLAHYMLGTLIVLLAFSLTLRPSAAQTARSTPDFSAIDRFVEQEMRATRLPGLALGIVQGDQVVYLQGFGSADPAGRRITPQTPFIIGSNSKSFTALAIMQLVEAGKVALDAPVQRYLPWFRVADEQASAQITVRHLLNQTSGLATVDGLPYLLRPDLSDGALEHDVRALQSVALTFPPGQTYQYCNMNFTTLALIIQTVTGESYEQYVQRQILTPLHMQNSFLTANDARQHGLATGYEFWFGRPAPTDVVYFNRASVPAGYISASAEDMAHYLIAQLNGGRYAEATILSPAGIAELHRPAIPSGDAFTFYHDSQYAMGWVSSLSNGIPTVWHNGDTIGFHAHMLLAPAERWGVVLLTNGQNELQGARVERIGVGVLSLLVGRQPPAVGAQILRNLFWFVLAVCGLQMLGIVRSLLLLRRWRSQPHLRPQGALGYALQVGLPLALNLCWGWLCLVAAPRILETPLALLGLSDYGLLIIGSGMVALGWAMIRVLLVIWFLRQRAVRLTALPQPA